MGFAKPHCVYFWFLQWFEKDDVVIVESVGSVDDELACDTSIDLITNNLDVESIHLQCDKDLLEDVELCLATIEVQA